MDLELTRALYIINKEAKKHNDLVYGIRNRIKEMAFDERFDATQEEIEFAEKYGLDLTVYGYIGEDEEVYCKMSDSDIDSIVKEMVSDYEECTKNCYEEELSERLSEDEELKEIISDFFNGLTYEVINLVKMGTFRILEEERKEIENQLVEHGYDDFVEEIIFTVEDIENDYSKLIDIKENIEKLHNWLKDGYKKALIYKDNLYKLKDQAIKKSETQVTAYHRLKNSDYTCLAYYQINGFGFHVPVQINDDIEVSDDIEIEKIDSEIKLNESEIIPIDDCISMLIDYLKLDFKAEDIYEKELPFTAQKIEYNYETEDYSNYNRNYDDDYDYGCSYL